LGREYTINKEVLVIYEVPNDQLLRGPISQIADLAVTGQGWNLLRERWRNPVIEVSLPVIEQVDGRISKSDIVRLIEPRLSSSSLPITDFTFVPTSIVLEAKATKLVPIQLLQNIKYDQGHVPVSALSIQPDSVTLRGPKEMLDTLHLWLTDTLTKRTLKASFEDSLSLQTPTNLPGLDLFPAKVAVSQEIEAFAEKSFYVPVEIRNPPQQDSFKIFPQRVQLKVGVLQSDYRKIQPDSFRLVADLRGMRTEDQRNNIPLVLEQKPVAAVSVQYSQRALEVFVLKQ